MISRRGFLAATAAVMAARPRVRAAQAPPRPRPSPAQLRWQREELALFLHFGVNTFTDREWGDGHEDPSVFNPAALDCRQWARAARAAGFRTMILTAKHHDGFCLWPSAVTRHSVAASPFRGGQGDVVREFVDACRAEQLGAGLYLSPWDRNAESYGEGPRYNDFYVAQLTELLTGYGPLVEVWFDGANGEGPNGRKQQYDWPRVFGTVKRLQPDAVIFSDAGPDVRWIGNETGSAGDPNWSTVDPAVVPYPGASGPGITEALQHGDPNGTVWRPGETDVSIRPGWFYHPAEDARVKSADDLVGLYYSSVGRNSKLLLNVPPNRAGLLSDADVSCLAGMRRALDATLHEALPSIALFRRPTPNTGELTLSFVGPTAIAALRLGENIEQGQRVSRYSIEVEDGGGAWNPYADGQTIGYCKLERVFAPVARRLQIRIETVEEAVPLRVQAYAPAAPVQRS